ncbi:hypothetical protein QQ045_015229 [Rhodiola kirilowii]
MAHFHFMICITMLMSLLLSNNSRAMRPLQGNEESFMLARTLHQSLQRGRVPPSRSSPCTYIPGKSRGRCAQEEINVITQHQAAEGLHESRFASITRIIQKLSHTLNI